MLGLQLPDWPSCLLPLMIIAHLHPDSYHLFTFADRWCLAAQNVPCTIIPQCNCQLSVQNLWFHQWDWYSLLLLLLRRMLTCGYRSPLAAPLHLALQRPPHPTLQIPPSPLLPCSYLHIPYTTLQVPRYQRCRICCSVFQFTIGKSVCYTKPWAR